MSIDGKPVGLALSGGGFRATLFGLGSIWRLNDAGLLGKLDRISSVSGGSIVAGYLALRWKHLTFADGTATNFDTEIAHPILKFCEGTVDIPTGLRGLLNPFRSAGSYLQTHYDKHLFQGASIRDMPDATKAGNPRFVIYATNMQNGRSFRFRQDMIADWKLGVARNLDFPLALAVAASSGFPPLFSPIILKTEPSQWQEGENLPNLDRLRREIVLSDGGVYDNMGLETLLGKPEMTVLVSDAGAPFDIDESPSRTPMQLARVRDILIDQTRALRKRWLLDDLTASRRSGAYWGIDTAINDYAVANPLAMDTQVTASLAKIRTRLKGFGANTHGQLVNWGYALTDAAVRKHTQLPSKSSSQLPIPSAQLS